MLSKRVSKTLVFQNISLYKNTVLSEVAAAVVKPLRNTFLAAQLSNAVLTP
jgi:hypothetical protein